jgi:hypothetical protein
MIPRASSEAIACAMYIPFCLPSGNLLPPCSEDCEGMLLGILIKTMKIVKRNLKIPKGIIRIRKSKKDKQYNGQKKKDKMTNTDLQNIHIKLKIE